MTHKHEGEITVQASKGGRKITLDPIREKVLSILCREVESTIVGVVSVSGIRRN